jgi:sulfur relay (sulfurtransferase) DsrC/TusE family protein
MYFDDEDFALIALIKEYYNLTSDAAAVRLAIKRVAEEVKRHVSGTARTHRQNPRA